MCDVTSSATYLQILKAVRDRDLSSYNASLRRLRVLEMSQLSAAALEKWAYPTVLRLHLLSDLEEMVGGLLQLPCVRRQPAPARQ